MKKIYSYLGVLFLFFTVSSLNAQVFIEEDFDTAFPAGWTTGGENSSGVPQATGFVFSTAQACDVGSVRANAYNTIPIRWLQSTQQTTNGGDIQVSFEYKIVDWSAATNPTPANFGTANIQYTTDGGTNWVTYHTIDDTNHIPSNICEPVSHTLTGIPGGLTFEWRIIVTQANGDYYFYVDTFSAIEAVDCFNPIDLAATTISDTQAEVSWNSVIPDASQWNIEYGLMGYTQGNGTTVVTSTNPYILSGLTDNTEYDVYIQADCGGGDLSSWVGPVSFKTFPDCANYTLSVTATDGGVCYEGSATLTATAGGSGDDIFWYDAAIDGNLVGIGSSFVTPFIDETTSFWAAEVVHAGSLSGQAFANPTTFTNSTSNSNGLIFTVTNPIIIVDVEVFGTNATGGDITIELRDIDNGNTTIASTTATITGGGTAALPIPHTIPLNFEVPAAGNYRLVRTAATASVGMGYVSAANSSFPYPLGNSGEVTGGSSLTGTTTLQYFFFNWTIIESLALCESTRDEAVATVYDFIPVEAGATSTQINPGDTATLTATSTNPNYNYTWEPAASIAGSNVGASVTTVALTDNTTFTVTAVDNVTGCEATDEITILVFNTALCNDLDITNTDGAYICDEGTAILSATAAGISGDEIYWYDAAVGGNRVGFGSTFETPFLTQTTSYWAAEVLEDGDTFTGAARVLPTSTAAGFSTSLAYGVVFDAYEAFTINTVDIYPTSTTSSGEITLELRDNTGATLQTVGPISYPVGTGNYPAATAVPITINIDVPGPGTGYRLVSTSVTAPLVRESSGGNNPHPIATLGEVTAGWASTSVSPTTYYFFYNWTVSTAIALCESAREEVIATVVDTVPVEATATATQIDPGTSTTLTAVSTNTDYVYTWEPVSSIAGSNVGTSVTTTNLTDHTDFTVTAVDQITGCTTTDEITILVFNTALCNTLDIVTVQGGFVCEEGTTNLSVTTSGTGDEVYWYDDEFGGNFLGIGTSFETPFIDETTSFWAAEVLLGSTIVPNQGEVVTTGTLGSTLTNYGITFNTTQEITIIDVEVFSTGGGGSIDIELRDEDNGSAVIASHTEAIPGGGTTTVPIPHTITLNFVVPPGNYRLVRATGAVSMRYNSGAANVNFPYPLGSSGEITGSGTGTSTTTYYLFYNWTISEPLLLCESTREEVIATVVDIDEVNVSATQTAISPGGSTTLTASSTNTNYSYAWTWDGGSDSGASIIVSPTQHTTYTVTATDTVTGCVAEAEITILVFDLTLCNTLDITATTGDTICVGETANLSATASGTGSVIYWYDDEFGGNKVGEGATFETPALTQTTSYWAAEVLREGVIVNPIETVYTAGSSTSVTSNPAAITFAIENTNIDAVVITAIENLMPANTTREHELWYHPTSITGPTGAIEAANGWIQIGGPQTTTSNAVQGISLVLDNLSFSIPGNTTYRFALLKTDNISGVQTFLYWNASASPNVFVDGGVNIYVGDSDAGTGSGNVGYAGTTTPANTPRAFTGIVHFQPAYELCESDREEAIATVTSDDAPMGDANQTFDPGDTLADLDVTGVNLTWYEDAAGTIVIPNTTLLVDGETYYVSQTINGCESQLLAITVTMIQPCDAPTGLTLVTVTTTTAEISWTASATETNGYAWYVFADGDDPTTDPSLFDGTVATGVTTVTISGLTAATDYDVYVSTLCAAGAESALAGPLSVLTDTAPAAPANDECTNAIALVVGTDFADQQVVGTNQNATNDPNDPLPTCDAFNFATNGKDVWYTVTVPASGYLKVETRSNGDAGMTDTGLQIYSGTCGNIVSIECNADDGIGNFSLVDLSGLTPGEVLLVRVWGYNTNEGEFLISAYDDFVPGGFPAPYCGPLVFTSDVEPITNVDVAGISNTSSNVINGSPGHEDFTAIIGTMEQGGTYTIALEGNTGGNWVNRFVVFIDWNQNGILDDAGEVYQIAQTIQNSTGIDGQQAIGTITVPAGAALGQTRMRVKKIFGTTNYLDPCLGTGFGQAEDYTIDVIPPAPVCPMPLALNIDTVTDTTIDFSWTPPTDISDVEGYFWRLMNSGDDPLVDPPVDEDFVVGPTSTSTSITGLTPDTDYDLYLVSVCDQTTLFVSDPLMVAVTTDQTFVCEMPTDITPGTIEATTAEFSWTASATETNGYEWAVFNAGDDPMVDPSVASGTVATGVTSVTVTGLDPETDYDFYVRTDCDPDGMSDWEGPFAFTTDILSVNDHGIAGFTFYPNPMGDVVNVTAQVEIEKVVIFSLTGQKLIEKQVGSLNSQIDVSNFASGPYLMYVTTSTGKVGVFNLIKK